MQRYKYMGMNLSYVLLVGVYSKYTTSCSSIEWEAEVLDESDLIYNPLAGWLVTNLVPAFIYTLLSQSLMMPCSHSFVDCVVQAESHLPGKTLVATLPC